MRKFLVPLAACLLWVSCNNKRPKEAGNEATGETITETVNEKPQTESGGPATDPFEKFLGSYVGPFGENKITLLITRIWGDSVQGRSIVGGNDRPFLGTHTYAKDGSFRVDAREPGDHKDDGVFRIFIQPDSTRSLSGNWIPNDTKRKGKDFSLVRRQFEYRADVGTWPESSQRLLTAKDVENLMKEELEFMRNEIFARHGYCFSRKHLRQQFEMEEWYVPNTVDIKGFLTEIEKKNIALIKRYEKYAEEYGDEYGR